MFDIYVQALAGHPQIRWWQAFRRHLKFQLHKKTPTIWLYIQMKSCARKSRTTLNSIGLAPWYHARSPYYNLLFNNTTTSILIGSQNPTTLQNNVFDTSPEVYMTNDLCRLNITNNKQVYRSGDMVHKLELTILLYLLFQHHQRVVNSSCSNK